MTKNTREFGGKQYYLADSGSKAWMARLAKGFRKIKVTARIVAMADGDYRLWISDHPAKYMGRNGAPKYNVNPFDTWPLKSAFPRAKR